MDRGPYGMGLKPNPQPKLTRIGGLGVRARPNPTFSSSSLSLTSEAFSTDSHGPLSSSITGSPLTKTLIELSSSHSKHQTLSLMKPFYDFTKVSGQNTIWKTFGGWNEILVKQFNLSSLSLLLKRSLSSTSSKALSLQPPWYIDTCTPKHKKAR